MDYAKIVELGAEDSYLQIAFSNLGFAYNAKEDYDRAITNFTHAIELNPDELDNYMGRATAYMGKGNTAEAIADLKTHLELAHRNDNE